MSAPRSSIRKSALRNMYPAIMWLYSSCAKESARELICTLKNCGGSVPRLPRTVVRIASTTVAGACATGETKGCRCGLHATLQVPKQRRRHTSPHG